MFDSDTRMTNFDAEAVEIFLSCQVSCRSVRFVMFRGQTD